LYLLPCLAGGICTLIQVTARKGCLQRSLEVKENWEGYRERRTLSVYIKCVRERQASNCINAGSTSVFVPHIEILALAKSFADL